MNFNTLDDLANAYYDKKDKNHNKAKKIFEWDINKLKGYKNNGCTKTEVCIHWCHKICLCMVMRLKLIYYKI